MCGASVKRIQLVPARLVVESIMCGGRVKRIQLVFARLVVKSSEKKM